MYDLNPVLSQVQSAITGVGLKVLGAVALWIAGRWLIGLAVRLLEKALSSRNIDRTLTSYIGVSVKVLLSIALVVAILGFFGVQTTTFAALIAAAGVAIGLAWSGLWISTDCGCSG